MAYFMISKTFRAKEIEKCDRLSERYWAVLRTSRLMNGRFFLLHISLADLALLARTEKVFMQEFGWRLFGKWPKILKQWGSLVSIACPVVRVYPSTG